MTRSFRQLIGALFLASLGNFVLAQDSLLFRSIESAPIAPNGLLSGAIPDFVMNFDISPDPSVAGFTFLQGEKIRINLPSDFKRTTVVEKQVPVANVFSSDTCAPGNLECTTAIMVQGWPQHPILPLFPPTPFGEGTPQVALDLNNNVFEIEMLRDITMDGPLAGPGVKTLHVILKDYENPTSGDYEVGVEFLDTNGAVTANGTALVSIVDALTPRMTVATVLAGAPGNPNTIYQTTTPGAEVPLPYDFYLWDETGGPIVGADIVHENDSLLIKVGDRKIGTVSIDTPPGGEDALIFTKETFDQSLPSFLIGADSGRLQAIFQAGAEPGNYTVKFLLDGGNSVEMFTHVVPESASFWPLILGGLVAFYHRGRRIRQRNVRA